MLRESSMPATIVEGGFISNPQECALLKSLGYQEKTAKGIATVLTVILKKSF